MSTLIQPPPPGYRKWWWVPAVLVVVALVVAAVNWLPPLFEPDNSCGPGVVRSGPDNECVGVTDGSFPFDPELEGIERRILDQNRAVDDSREPYVSIVTMSPMTTDDSEEGTAPLSGIRHRLEGAHLAQLAANRTWGGTPKIKLLVANPGRGFGEWETAVDKIQERREADRIVAVTGIAFSLQPAVQAIQRLSELDMPVVGSTLTADDLPTLRGFFRISPPAAEHARAAAEYLLATHANRIMVIRDDNQVDHYGLTLAAAFTARFHDVPQRLVERPETYDSGVSTAASTFRRMLPNICQNAPDTIYFAGRAGHALSFLTALAERTCRTPLRILTADDMAGRRLDGSPAGIALETGVSVLYTGQVHPQAWSDDPNRFSPSALGQFADDCAGDVCFRAFSEDRNLEDFAAIMEYDAAGTAVEAIRRAAEYAGPSVGPGHVVQEMKQMHGATAMLGASGRLDFDENGLPIDKTIPILETKVGEPTAYVGLP